jgi:transposase
MHRCTNPSDHGNTPQANAVDTRDIGATGPRYCARLQSIASRPVPVPVAMATWSALTPHSTHQVIEVPPIELAVHHFLLQQGQCPGGGRQRKAQVPSHHQAGYGPRLSARSAALAGIQRTSWRLVQDCCPSVLNLPISLGAVQTVIRRVSDAIAPHDEAIATLAPQAPVGDSDDTPWDCQNAVQWLWRMATDKVADSRIAPHRSTEALWALIAAWPGLLVSDGYGVYQDWVNQRQTCLAHLIRTARGWSQRRAPDLAACGNTARKALQRLCPMAHEPPTGGQWQAWSARFCRLRDRYQERSDDAGRLVRRLAREMTALWVLLRAQGVDPPNTLAERG